MKNIGGHIKDLKESYMDMFGAECFHPVDIERFIEHTFVSGARSEREELTRWNNPDDHPKRGVNVLVKCNAYPGIHYIVGYWSGVCFYNSLNDRRIINVIGWREIHE